MDLVKLAEDAVALLVSSATTDLWGSIKYQIATILGRGRAEHVGNLEGRLDEFQQELTALDGSDAQPEQERLALIWQGRVIALLEADPDTARVLGEFLTANALPSSKQGDVQISNVRASGHAIQIVVGAGQVHIGGLAPATESPQTRRFSGKADGV